MSPADPTRRSILAAASAGLAWLAAAGATAALTGCARTRTATPGTGTTAPGTEPLAGSGQIGSPVDPERVLRNRLAVGSVLLIMRYRATIDRHPSLSDRLTWVLDDHDTHLRTLTGVGTTGDRRRSAPAARGGPAGSPVEVAAGRSAAVRDLIAAESAAAAHRQSALDTARTPGLTTLLAALVASHRSHGQLLRSEGKPFQVKPAPLGRLPGPVGQGTVAALQEALAAEHATVFGYGALGAWLSGGSLDRARDAHDAHRRRRDRLAQLVRHTGAEPVAAAAGYRLPFAVAGDKSARRLAAHLENGLADAYGWVVAATAPGDALRTGAAGWLVEAALWAASWSGTSRALPGLPAAAPNPTSTSTSTSTSIR